MNDAGNFGVIGTLTFDVLSSDWFARGQDTDSIFGPFLDFHTFEPIPIEYNSVPAVPVPAAAWLMFGGLAALFGVGRKRA